MKTKGFTLIELLVVIAIIGILSVVAFITLTNVKERARDAIRVADIDQIGKALDLFSIQNNGSYPISIVGGECIDGTDIVTTTLQSNEFIQKPIVDPIFTDPAQCYLFDSDGTNFTIRYTLESNSVKPAGDYFYQK